MEDEMFVHSDEDTLLDAIADRVAERLRGPEPSALEVAVEAKDWPGYLRAVKERAIEQARGERDRNA